MVRSCKLSSQCIAIDVINLFDLAIGITSGNTRILSECLTFGFPKDISFRSLPTYENVMNLQNPSFKQIAVAVAQQLETLRKNSSIAQILRKKDNQHDASVSTENEQSLKGYF